MQSNYLAEVLPQTRNTLMYQCLICQSHPGQASQQHFDLQRGLEKCSGNFSLNSSLFRRAETQRLSKAALY